jgi:hypothetical protein
VAGSCDVQFTLPASQVSCVIANVPSGKVLVIETISCAADAPPGGDAPNLALLVNSTPVSGGAVSPFYYFLALPKVSTTSTSDNYRITTSVRMYAAPGTSVTLIASGESGPSLIADTTCAISGHLVNP